MELCKVIHFTETQLTVTGSQCSGPHNIDVCIETGRSHKFIEFYTFVELE